MEFTTLCQMSEVIVSPTILWSENGVIFIHLWFPGPNKILTHTTVNFQRLLWLAGKRIILTSSNTCQFTRFFTGRAHLWCLPRGAPRSRLDPSFFDRRLIATKCRPEWTRNGIFTADLWSHNRIAHWYVCVCVYKQDIDTKSERGRVSYYHTYIIYVHTHVYIAVYWLVPQRLNN